MSRIVRDIVSRDYSASRVLRIVLHDGAGLPPAAILIDYSDDAPYPDFPTASLMTKCRIKDSVGRHMKEG